VKFTTAFIRACNWSPSRAIWILFPFPHTVSPLSALVIFSLCDHVSSKCCVPFP
jgi:hypothetical protein